MNLITRLIIARHGNTFGPNDIVTRVGTTDLPLVPQGILQGERLGDYLKNNNLVPDIIYTSKLQRTKQTATAAIDAMQQIIHTEELDIFNEIDYGPDENKPEAQVLSRIGDDALKYWNSKCIPPLGWKVDPAAIINNWQNFAANIATQFKGKNILVITSNGIARFAQSLIAQEYAHCKVATGALCILEKQYTSWSCVKWNFIP